MKTHFARRMDCLRASEIRELLKITQHPEIISFAGGLPAPEVFPIEEMKLISRKVLEDAGAQALQYSVTEGFEPLRAQIARRMNNKFKTNVTRENVLITSGSQQALDFTGKLFLDKGDVVLCESPTYLAAISAFRAYEPNFIEVPTDNNGMIMEELERIIQTTEMVKFIYVIPDFQNPTGRTWSLERRQRFIDIISDYEIPVIEDNPYGELRFEGEMLPSIKSFDTKGLVIFVSTFSKTLCPGMRIGWLAADQRFVEKYVLIKQGADLHTSSISQRQIACYIELYDLDDNLQKIINVYRSRRDAMLDKMRECFPANVKYTYPQGGMFTWVELPGQVKAVELLEQCLKNQVAFVPGDSFFPNGGVSNTLRLNYSNMPEDKIREGIIRLADAMKKFFV